MPEGGRLRIGGFEVCGPGKLLTEPKRWAFLMTQIDRVSDATEPISTDCPPQGQ